MKLAISIPTYNRAKLLIKNLYSISDYVESLELKQFVNVYVIDNASFDSTYEDLKHFLDLGKLNMVVKRNEHTISVGENVAYSIFCPNMNEDYVMIMGDDDFFSKKYLEKIFTILKNQSPICIIPNMRKCDSNFKFVSASREAEDLETIESSDFKTNIFLSVKCHQMSGIVFSLKNVKEEYYKIIRKSMYPQIYLAFFLSGKGKFIHVFENPISVTITNCKHWKYDASGYITDILSGISYLDIKESEKRKIQRKMLFELHGRFYYGFKHPYEFWKEINKEKRISINLKIYIGVFFFFLFPLYVIKEIYNKISMNKNGDN